MTEILGSYGKYYDRLEARDQYNKEQNVKPLFERVLSSCKNYMVSIMDSEEFKTAFFAFGLGLFIGQTGIFPDASIYERSVSAVPPHHLLNDTCVLK